MREKLNHVCATRPVPAWSVVTSSSAARCETQNGDWCCLCPVLSWINKGEEVPEASPFPEGKGDGDSDTFHGCFQEHTTQGGFRFVIKPVSASSCVQSAWGASLIPASSVSRCEVTVLSASFPPLGEGGRDPRFLPTLVIPVFIVLNQRCCWGQVTPYSKCPLSRTRAGKMTTVPHLHARRVEAWIKIFVRFTVALPFRLWSLRHCGVLSCFLLTADDQD